MVLENSITCPSNRGVFVKDNDVLRACYTLFWLTQSRLLKTRIVFIFDFKIVTKFSVAYVSIMYSYHLPGQATSITPPNHYRYPRRLFLSRIFLMFSSRYDELGRTSSSSSSSPSQHNHQGC